MLGQDEKPWPGEFNLLAVGHWVLLTGQYPQYTIFPWQNFHGRFTPVGCCLLPSGQFSPGNVLPWLSDLIFSCAALSPSVSSGHCPLNNGQFRPPPIHLHRLTFPWGFPRDSAVATICEETTIIEDIVRGSALANDNSAVKGQPDTMHFVIKTFSKKIVRILVKSIAPLQFVYNVTLCTIFIFVHKIFLFGAHKSIFCFRAQQHCLTKVDCQHSSNS